MKTAALTVILIVIPVLSFAQSTDIRDRNGNLVGTRNYDRTTGETQFRDRNGNLEYTGNRRGNEYEIRDRSGNLKWTEESDD